MALYTFLSNNSKFREFGKKFWTTVMLQLISIIFCAGALVIETIKNSLMCKNSKFLLGNKIYSLFIIVFYFFIQLAGYICVKFFTLCMEACII